MNTLTYFTYLAFLVSGTISMLVNTPELKPVLAPSHPDGIIPTDIISMHYGVNGSRLANVTLHLDNPGVLLEQVENASSVECDNSSVTTTFDSPGAFERSKAEWPQNREFVLITNHQGNCDEANERGIFIVNTLRWNNATMQVVANAERKDIHDAASTLEVDFSRLVSDHPAKRDITFHKDGLNMAGDMSLPRDMEIFSVDPFFTATANKAYLSDNITFSGYMKYHIHDNNLEAMYFDLDASLTADLGFTFDFTTSWNHNLTFSPDALQLSTINIPKILQLGPSLRWGIGVEVGAGMGLSVDTEVWAQITDGRLHLDFADDTQSHAEGWMPQYQITLGKIEQSATIFASPFVQFTAELGLRILGGKLDLSGGFTAETMFVNEVSLVKPLQVIPIEGGDSDGHINSGAGPDRTGIAVARDVDCGDRLTHHTALDFSVTAFLTEKWDKTLYSYETGASDTCYP